MSINEKMRLLRLKMNMTQLEFASLLGVTRGHVTNIESGRTIPTELYINCVAAIFGINKAWFTDESNDNIDIPAQSSNPELIDKYKSLRGNYREFAEKQLDQLLEWQEKEEKASEDEVD